MILLNIQVTLLAFKEHLSNIKLIAWGELEYTDDIINSIRTFRWYQLLLKYRITKWCDWFLYNIQVILLAPAEHLGDIESMAEQEHECGVEHKGDIDHFSNIQKIS